MYRNYLDFQRDGLDYNLAYVPEDFDLKPNADFDPVYLAKLFDLGHQLASYRYIFLLTLPIYSDMEAHHQRL